MRLAIQRSGAHQLFRPAGIASSSFATSSRSSYASPSAPASMAEVVDHHPSARSAGIGGLQGIDEIAARPETLVLSPGEDSLGFEGTKKQEAIGRPIYLDMQVSRPSLTGPLRAKTYFW